MKKRPMKKRPLSLALFFVLTLCVALALCACAGGGDSAPADPGNTPDDGAYCDYEAPPAIGPDDYVGFSGEEQPEELCPAEEYPEEEKFDLSAGPLLVNGNFAKGFTVAQLNLSDGSMNTVFPFVDLTQKGNQGPLFSAFSPDKQVYLPSFFAAQLFDGGMTKLAVSWTDLGDSSQHVGWVDREGDLTDVTQLVHPHTADFSSKAPRDTYALFAPDGTFLFVDRNDECYCCFDPETMSVVKTEPLIVQHGRYSDTTFYQVTFQPDGSMSKLWHTEDNSYGGADAILFGDCRIVLPAKSYWLPAWTTWDYLEGDVILCIRGDSEGYYIAEIGRGIGTPDETKYQEPLYNSSFYVTHREEDCLAITAKTDYKLESAAYYDGQIAFIGSRGQERYLFTVENAPGSDPSLIAPVDPSWDILFW